MRNEKKNILQCWIFNHTRQEIQLLIMMANVDCSVRFGLFGRDCALLDTEKKLLGPAMFAQDQRNKEIRKTIGPVSIRIKRAVRA